MPVKPISDGGGEPEKDYEFAVEAPAPVTGGGVRGSQRGSGAILSNYDPVPYVGISDYDALGQELYDALNAEAPDRYIEKNTPTWNDVVKNRAEAWQDPYWSTDPITWGNIVTSRYREQLVSDLLKEVPKMHTWIAQQNQFGGVDGALINLRARALQIQNPAKRIQALKEIEALAQLTPQEQYQFITLVQGGGLESGTFTQGGMTEQQRLEAEAESLGLPLDPETAARTAATDEAIALRSESGEIGGVPVATIGKGLTQLMGTQYGGLTVTDEGERQVLLHGRPGEDNVDVKTQAVTDPETGKRVLVQGENRVYDAKLNPLQKATIYTMFPTLKDVEWGEVVGFEDVAKSVAGSQGVNSVVYAAGKPIVEAEGFNPLAIGQSFVNTAGVLGAIPFKAVGAVGGGTLRATGADELANDAGGAARGFEQAMGWAAQQAGQFVSDVDYAITGTRMAPETQEFWGNVGLIVALHGATEAAGTYVKYRGKPAEALAAELRITPGSPLKTLAEQFRQKDGSYGLTMQNVFHPLRTTVSPLVRLSTYEVLQFLKKSNVESFVHWSKTQKFFSEVLRVRREMPLDQARAHLVQRYPSMSRNQGWLEALLDENVKTEAQMAEATIKYAKRARLMDATRSANLAAAALKEAKESVGEHQQGTITLTRAEAEPLLQFPERAPRKPGEKGTAGAMTILFDPATGKGLITEGHHRILGATNDVVLHIKIVGTEFIDNKVANGRTGVVLPEHIQRQIYDTTAKVYDGQVGLVPLDLLEQYLDPNMIRTENADGSFGLKSREEFQALKDKIESEGFDPSQPIQVDYNPITQKAVVSEGYHRLAIARQLGIDKVPVEILRVVREGPADKLVPDATLRYPENAFSESGPLGPTVVNYPYQVPSRMHPSAVFPFPEVAMPDVPARLAERISALETEYYATKAAKSEVFMDTLPVMEFPTSRTMPDFMHRVMYKPTTVTERIFRTILNPIRTVKRFSNAHLRSNFNPDGRAWAKNLTDKLDNDAVLTAPHVANDPATKAYLIDQNITYVNRLFDRFGVTEADRTAAIAKMLAAKTTQEFWEVATRDLFGEGGVLAKYMPKNTPLAWKRSFLGRYDVNSLNYRSAVLSDGQWEPVLAKDGDRLPDTGEKVALPAAPSEFSRSVPLPRMSEIDRIMSGWQRAKYNLAEAENFGSRGIAFAMNIADTALHVTTAFMKPLVLMFNVPAIVLTQQLDEALSAYASPNIVGAFKPGRYVHENIGAIDPNITGNTLAGFFLDETPGRVTVENIALRDILADPARHRDVFASLLDDLDHVRTDRLYSTFLRLNMDKVKMRELLEGGDPELTRFYNDNLKRVLEGSEIGAVGDPLGAYLDRVESYLRGVTFDFHPDFVKYAKNGRLGTSAGIGKKKWNNNVDRRLVDEYDKVKLEIDELRQTLADPEFHPFYATPENQKALIPTYRALQHRLREALEEADLLEGDLTRLGGELIDKNPILTPTNRKRIIKDIERRVLDGEIVLPDNLRLHTGRATPGGHGSALDWANTNASKGTMLLYEGFRFETRLKGRRAAAIAKKIDERTKSLVRKGMPEDRAARIAEFEIRRRRGFSLHKIGEAEGRFARGSYYEQRAFQYAQGAKAQGLPEAAALEYGRLRANIEARDISYDLTARSSLERQTRNLFWFAPVTGEIMYRWLYAIPAQSGGWLPGLALTAAKGAAWYNFLQDLGILQQDAEGMDYINVGGASDLIEALSFGALKLPDNAKVPLASLSPLPTVIPSASPIVGWSLNQIAKRSQFPVIKQIADAFTPFDSSTIIPSTIRNLFGMMGVKVPDLLSNDYVNLQWDRTHDQAYRYAFTDMQKAGDVAPQLSDYVSGDIPTEKEEDAYLRDWNDWFDRLNTETNRYAKGLYASKLLSSAAIPGYIIPTSDEEEVYNQFWQKNILPQMELNNGVMSDETRANLAEWLGEHPDSFAYTVSYGYYTGKKVPKELQRTDADYYTELYMNDVKSTMPPEEYGELLAAMGSRNLYQSRLAGQLNALGDTPKEVLMNWGERKAAISRYQRDWQDYLTLHPDAESIINTNTAAMEAAYGIDRDSLQQKYMTEVLTGLSRLSPYFTGEDGVLTPEAKEIIGTIKGARAKLYEATEGDVTPLEAGISYYFDSVIDPYFKEVDPLYRKAEEAEASGNPDLASTYYEQISEIKQNRAYQNPRYGKHDLPSIEEFFFNSKTKREQKYAITGWTTKPLSWLTPWEREQVGYPDFEGSDNLSKELQAQDDAFYDFVRKNDIHPSSNWYEDVVAWSESKKLEIANKYGEAGVEFLRLEEADPYLRLKATGWGEGNETWQQVYKARDLITRRLDAAEVGDGSEYGVALKLWLYDYINRKLKEDPVFREQMEHLSNSTSPLAGTEIHPTGVYLWEAIFFSNYNPAYISPDLKNVYR